MTEETSNGLPAPNLSDSLRAGWETFKKHAPVLVGAFAIFAGAGLFVSVLLQFLAGALGSLLVFLLSTASVLPSLLLLPGLYTMALKASRDQKPEIRDLFLIFNDRFVHHLAILLLQSCGALVCCIGALVTQALFIPGSFLVIDRGMNWDRAMQTCVESLKPKLVNWILFHLVLAVVGFSGVLFCGVGVFVSGPIALCAWAHGYKSAFKDFSAEPKPAP